MSATTTVPVTIEPKAAERIAELGMQAEFEQMLEFARATVPELKRLVVQWCDPYDTGSEPGILIMANSGRPYDPEDRTWDRLTRWMVETIPPTVAQHFSMIYLTRESHEG